eukprot:9398858-Pyramimonas_sp.AAC.1
MLCCAIICNAMLCYATQCYVVAPVGPPSSPLHHTPTHTQPPYHPKGGRTCRYELAGSRGQRRNPLSRTGLEWERYGRSGEGCGG